MYSSHVAAFRPEAIRDLLGLVRIVYRDLPSPELEAAGKSLAQAVALSASPHGSVGYRAALLHTKEAIETLRQVETARPYLRAGIQAAIGK